MLEFLGTLVAAFALCLLWIGGYLVDFLVWIISKIIPASAKEKIVGVVIGVIGFVIGFAIAAIGGFDENAACLPGGLVAGVGIYIAILLPSRVRRKREKIASKAAQNISHIDGNVPETIYVQPPIPPKPPKIRKRLSKKAKIGIITGSISLVVICVGVFSFHALQNNDPNGLNRLLGKDKAIAIGDSANNKSSIIVQDEEFIYFPGDSTDNCIYKVSKNDGSCTIFGRIYSASNLYVREGWLYITALDAPKSETEYFYRINTDSGEKNIMGSEPFGAATSFGSNREKGEFYMNGDLIYYYKADYDDFIQVLNVETGEQKDLRIEGAEGDAESMKNFCVTGNSLFFEGPQYYGKPAYLCKLDLLTNKVYKLAPCVSGINIITSDDWVYYYSSRENDFGSGDIFRMKSNGADIEEIGGIPVSGDTQLFISGRWIFSSTVYYENEEGAILRFDKDKGEATLSILKLESNGTPLKLNPLELDMNGFFVNDDWLVVEVDGIEENKGAHQYYLFKASTNGEALELVYSSNKAFSALGIIDDWVYYLEEDSAPGRHQIPWRMNLNTQETVQLIE
ncbi:MAG: DUF5050 domain-containing protein [Clostridiales Family XIII bacterium]|jgi:hypothetical protein|nr:DUF5050 domain-containing protein [Clostridiales Family XIII bacterium]